MEIRHFIINARHYGNNLTIVFNGFGSVPNSLIVLCDRIRLHAVSVDDLQRASSRHGIDGEFMRELEDALYEIRESEDRYEWRMVDKNGYYESEEIEDDFVLESDEYLDLYNDFEDWEMMLLISRK